jgi:hypothetical protein
MQAGVPVSRRLFWTSILSCAAAVVAPQSLGADDAAPSSCVDITGCWNCGCWRSFCNSHHGKLRAVITRCDDCHYKCTFSGTFFGVIPFRYTATLTVTGHGDGVVYFRSSRNIPLFGGQFSMCGSATSCKFTANYTSPKDRGVFTLSR